MAVHASLLLLRGRRRAESATTARKRLKKTNSKPADVAGRTRRGGQARRRRPRKEHRIMIGLTAAIGIGFALIIGLMSLGLHVAFVMFAISIARRRAFTLARRRCWRAARQFWGANEDYVLRVDPAVHPARRDPGARRRHRQDVPLAVRLADARSPAACCTPTSARRRCSPRCRAPRWPRRPPSPPLHCRPSRRAVTTSASCWARIAAGATLGILIPP